MRNMTIIPQILLIIGGLNWLLVGLFQLDLVAVLFSGQGAILSRIVYILVGLSAIWMIAKFSETFRERPISKAHVRPPA